MSDVVKHVRIPTTKIGDAQITESKFNEHFEHGTAVAVTATGRHITFNTAFGGSPDPFVSGRGSAAIVKKVTSGSMLVQLVAAGTTDVLWQAWGPRA